MAQSKRSASGSAQPISQHPLFAGIVGLWCAAGLGLASMAIPPALLERLVTASGLASVLPMAAPPLGSTARILVALAMTGIGGIIGFVAARRMTRAPSEPMPRRRGAKAETRALIGDAADDTTPSQIPAFPASSDDQDAPLFAAPVAAEAPAAQNGGRRRALALYEEAAISHSDVPAQAQAAEVVEETDLAPDIAVSARLEHDLDFPAQDDTAISDDAVAYEEAQFSALSVGARSFAAAEGEDHDASDVAIGAAAELTDSEADFTDAPLAAGKDLDPASAPAEFARFARLGDHDASEADAPAPAPLASNRLFENLTTGIPAPSSRRSDAEPGFSLLPRQGESAEGFVVPPFSLSEAGFDMAESPFHPAAQTASDPQPKAPAAQDTQPVPAVEESAADRPATPTAAEQITLSDLDSLSPVQLLERLALAMEERRKIRMAQPAPLTLAPYPPQPTTKAPAAVVTASQANWAPTTFSGLSAAAHTADTDAADTPPTADAAASTASAPVEADEPADEDAGNFSPAPAPAPTQIEDADTSTGSGDEFAPQASSHFTQVAQLDAPTTLSTPETSTWDRPFADPLARQAATEYSDDPVEDPLTLDIPVDHAFAADTPTPTPSPRIPVALRPVALAPIDDSFADEDDGSAVPAYIPPRHIGLVPSPAVTSFDQPFAAPAQPQAPAFLDDDAGDSGPVPSLLATKPLASLRGQADGFASETAYASEDYGDEDKEDEGEEADLDAGYSSLLSLSRTPRTRQSFVRIEDAEDEATDQPAVVFPAAEPQPAAQIGEQRPFDAPLPDSRLGADSDPRDTERALRAALATLQRMSGTG